MAKPTVVAGLDTASNRYHLYCNNGFTVHVHFPGKISAADRRHMLYSHALVQFQQLPSGTLLIIEEPLSLQNGKTSRVLAMAAASIEAATYNLDLYVAWADVSAWKAKVVGNGSADKEAIKRWVIANLGLTWPEEKEYADYYDAACLAEYGRLQLL